MLIFLIVKIKFWFILGLPYGAFIPSEEEKKKQADKEKELAEKYPKIFSTDRDRFDDFQNLPAKEMQNALLAHYANIMKNTANPKSVRLTGNSL